MEEAIAQFRGLTLHEFGAKDAIDLSAFVELHGEGGSTRYFIGPRAGGTEIVHAGKTVLVITPQSPLGQQLMGAKSGDRLKIQIGGTRSDYRVAAVA